MIVSPRIIAHRGASAEAPENTLAAADLAWRQGADGIEIDVRMTRDNKIVVIHDATVKRTAGKPARIHTTNLTQLRQFDVGRFKGAEWAGERLPTLEEMIRTVPRGKHICIELKSGSRLIHGLAEVLARTGLDVTQVSFLAFDRNLISSMKQSLPQYRALWNKHGLFRMNPSIQKLIDQAVDSGLDGLSVGGPLYLNPRVIQAIREAGLHAYVWTVDQPGQAKEMKQAGAEYIITNRPGYLKAALGQDMIHTGVKNEP